MSCLSFVRVSPHLITFNVGRAKNKVTNQYLRLEGNIPTNLSPIILPFDCVLDSVTSATKEADTWNIEIHSNLSLLSSIAVINSKHSNFSNLNIMLSKGSPIEIYLNGVNVSYPNVSLIFKEYITSI